ncbi:carboxypeptidase-like regulatory domain-containing protein, partial [Singulisphaera rosea]
TRPATVRGRVRDPQGRPIAGREIRATPTDRLENRYDDPTTRTRADGTYELKFLRPAEQCIQVAPFWIDPFQAPLGTYVTLPLGPGESRDGVDYEVLPEKGGD